MNWQDITTKLPTALNKLGQIACGFEQMRYQREMTDLQYQNPCIWSGYRGGCGMGGFGGNSSAVLYSGITDMDNFTQSVIYNLEHNPSGPAPSTTNPTTSSTPDNSQTNTIQTSALAEGNDVEFIKNQEWQNLNDKYESLESNEKQNWLSGYKDGLSKLGKTFMQTISGSSSSTTEINKEQFEEMIKAHINKNSRIADSEVKDLADKLWDNANIDGNDTIDEKELNTLLAMIDEMVKRDGKITSQEFSNSIQNLGKEEFKEKFDTKYNELYGSSNKDVAC